MTTSLSHARAGKPVLDQSWQTTHRQTHAAAGPKILEEVGSAQPRDASTGTGRLVEVSRGHAGARVVADAATVGVAEIVLEFGEAVAAGAALALAGLPVVEG